jgi:hypothetical protein
MRQVILHIGTEKTGTSSIQSYLTANRLYLREKGVLYPASLGHESHVWLANHAAGFMDREDENSQLRKLGCGSLDECRDKIRRGLLAEVAKSACETVILSSEHCSSRLQTEEHVLRLKTLVGEISNDVVVVVYLREQSEFLTSRFSTAMKAGYGGPLVAPGEQGFKSQCDYAAMLDRWAEAFGKEKLRVRLFQKGDLRNDDVVADFLEVCGLPDIELPVRPQHVNEAVGAAGLEFLSIANEVLNARGVPRRGPLRRRLFELVSKNSKGPRARFTADQINTIKGNSLEINKRLSQEYFSGRWPLFVEAEEGAARHEFGHATKSELIELAVNIFVRQFRRGPQASDGEGKKPRR